MKKMVITCLIFIVSFCLMASTVNAAGPFDQTCSNCQGTGTVTHSSTITCPTCQGNGEITTTGTCDKCSGTGKITVTTTCSVCNGQKTIRPSIREISKEGAGTLSGLDWVARCSLTLQNEEDQGTYCVVESKVHTVSNDYTRQSARTYLPPHTNVKVTIDTGEVGWLTDWTYTIYVKSVDSITCSACQGSGGSSSVANCDRCNGQGTVTTTNTCSNCHGTKTITQQKSQTCQTCGGPGYVTNWTMVSIVAVISVALVAGGAGGVMFYKKSHHK